jgi:hypothetical protein
VSDDPAGAKGTMMRMVEDGLICAEAGGVTHIVAIKTKIAADAKWIDPRRKQIAALEAA